MHDELMRFFIHQFVSARIAHPSDATLNDTQIIGKVTSEFMEFLDLQKESDDKWIATCANFLQMSFDFIEFVNGFRVGDSIVIEKGYQKQSPVWEILGQKKYVEVFYSQQETLYRDFPYSRLQELRINRSVRRYHGKTGKRCVAQDEFLEHGNRFFSEFALPSTLTGFEMQSWYVGIGLMCKRFTNHWYTNVVRTEEEKDYRCSVGSRMTPEMKLIYQVFGLLNTHVQSDERTGGPDGSQFGFGVDFVLSVKDQIDIDLRREVLERDMSETLEVTSAKEIIGILDEVYGESIDSAGISPTATDGDDEGELNSEEAAEVAAVEAAEAAADERTREARRPAPKKNIKKKEMHRLISDNPWSIGKAKLRKKDVVARRLELDSIRHIRSKLRRAIINNIAGAGNKSTNSPVGSEQDVRTGVWQRRTKRVNTLGIN